LISTDVTLWATHLRPLDVSVPASVVSVPAALREVVAQTVQPLKWSKLRV